MLKFSKHFHINEEQRGCGHCMRSLLQGIIKVQTVDVITVRVDLNITEIKQRNFFQCENLRSIFIPNSVKEIGNAAFKGCSSLQSIVIPKSVEKISYWAFSGCSSLQSICIPDAVTEIGSAAFSGCSSLQSIFIPDSVKEIGSAAFKDCSSLQSIVIPKSVEIISHWAFNGCSSLQSICIPDAVAEIGSAAFSGCSSLQSIFIPNSVKEIGSAAFKDCSSLQSIVIPKSVEIISPWAFSGCSSLQSICIPDAVKEIGSAAFSSCSSLQSIFIPDSVKKIGDKAFKGCSSLQSIFIPDSVKEVSWCAFVNCTSLMQRQLGGLNYHGNITEWLQHRFDNLPIHQACYNMNVTPAKLSALISVNKGTLSLTDDMGMTALHVLSCNPNITVEMIEMLKAASSVDVINMKDVIGMTPQMLFLKCKCFEEVHDIYDVLTSGFKGDDFECFLWLANAEEKKDIVQKLEQRNELGMLPFMHTAILPQCGLNVIYNLAMMCPDLCAKNEVFQ
jgi:hypothetical protein